MEAIKNKEIHRCNCCGKMFLKDCNEYTYTPTIFRATKKNR